MISAKSRIFAILAGNYPGFMTTYIPRFLNLPQESCFLFGPRGTGKSTFLRHHLPDAIWIDLLQAAEFRRYSSDPDQLESLVLGNPEQSDFVIDEIQRIPELLNVVHRLIELRPDLRFVLTGSSARKLKPSSTNFLAGRALFKNIFPFMISELGQKRPIMQVCQQGLIPLIVDSLDPETTLSSYVALYIEREVQQEALTRNSGAFNRFLEVISFSHGQTLNVSNVARDAAVARSTVQLYIEILEDILLAHRLPVFTKKNKRKLATHPKFYFFDSGVFSTIRPSGPLDRPQEIMDSALEGLVFQHLIAWTNYSDQKMQIYFWRSRGGVEVDFILYGTAGIFAVEVKLGDRTRPQEFRGLMEFGKDYPGAVLIMLYTGTRKLLRDNIWIVPCMDFLQKLSPQSDFSEYANT